MKSVSVIGGGLAGCEAAYVIAESGIHVNLFEMKPASIRLHTKLMTYANWFARTRFAQISWIMPSAS